MSEYCPECYLPIESKDNYCEHCGIRLRERLFRKSNIVKGIILICGLILGIYLFNHNPWEIESYNGYYLEGTKDIPPVFVFTIKCKHLEKDQNYSLNAFKGEFSWIAKSTTKDFYFSIDKSGKYNISLYQWHHPFLNQKTLLDSYIAKL